MKALDLTPYTMTNGKIRSFTDLGGYPIFFLCADSGILCPACVNNERELINAAEADQDKQWLIVAADVNWEDPALDCDNCNCRIESAYAEDDIDPREQEQEPDGYEAERAAMQNAYNRLDMGM